MLLSRGLATVLRHTLTILLTTQLPAAQLPVMDQSGSHTNTGRPEIETSIYWPQYISILKWLIPVSLFNLSQLLLFFQFLLFLLNDFLLLRPGQWTY